MHAHGKPQPILGFISIHVLLYTLSACGSKLPERIEIMVYVLVSFFGEVFLGTTRFLAIRQEGKIDMCFTGCCGRATCELLNLKCFWYDWYFFNITKFTKYYIWFFRQCGNLTEKLVRSLTKIFCRVDNNLIQLHLSKCPYPVNAPTYPVHGLLSHDGLHYNANHSANGTVGGNKLKDKARPELCYVSALYVFPLLWWRNEDTSTLVSVNDRYSHWSIL